MACDVCGKRICVDIVGRQRRVPSVLSARRHLGLFPVALCWRVLPMHGTALRVRAICFMLCEMITPVGL